MAEKLAFVDTHVHFWERPHSKLDWVWLADDAVHPQLGAIQPLKDLTTFTVPGLKADAEGSNVTKIVHVQAAIGSADPVDETEWLQAMADATGWPNGITADAPLQNPDVAGVLERHAQFANLRGIRDFAQGDYLVDPDFHRGYALLEKYQLVYELDALWDNMAKAGDLAKKFPNTTLILDHAGFPQERNDEYFAKWRAGLAAMAEAPNTVVKISGLGMGDYMVGDSWTVDSIRPYVLGCIEAFGVERSFFGSNWPVDRMYSDYSVLIEAYTEIIAGFSDSEKVALTSGNAERIYRI